MASAVSRQAVETVLKSSQCLAPDAEVQQAATAKPCYYGSLWVRKKSIFANLAAVAGSPPFCSINEHLCARSAPDSTAAGVLTFGPCDQRGFRRIDRSAVIASGCCQAISLSTRVLATEPPVGACKPACTCLGQVRSDSPIAVPHLHNPMRRTYTRWLSTGDILTISCRGPVSAFPEICGSPPEAERAVLYTVVHF